MIAKTLATAAYLGLCVLITFASSQTVDRSRITAGEGAVAATNVTSTATPGDDGIIKESPGPFAEFGKPVAACSDSIANCSDPVKHLGTQNNCACFACAYATPNQRTVCTSNPADKDALFKRAQ